MNGAFPPSQPSWAEAGQSVPSHRHTLGGAVLGSRREPSLPSLGTWGLLTPLEDTCAQH